MAPNFEFHPVTPERWRDLEVLFCQDRTCNNCWCMWWRLKRTDFYQQFGSENKEAMKRIVDAGEVPGLLAYAQGVPIAWCSVAPREAYPSLQRSPTLKRVDDKPVWSIVCFVVARPFRGQGLMSKLLEAAVVYARGQGAKIVEGYPIDPEKAKPTPANSYMGVLPVFQQAGFIEVLRRSERKPIMRYFVNYKTGSPG